MMLGLAAADRLGTGDRDAALRHAREAVQRGGPRPSPESRAVLTQLASRMPELGMKTDDRAAGGEVVRYPADRLLASALGP
jgi:hypothetical protein